MREANGSVGVMKGTCCMAWLFLLALSTGLPFAVRAEKANVFFVQSGGNLTRSHISPERNELRSRRYAGRATEFLCDEWLGARQSANSSSLRGAVSPCEPFRVPNATGPRSLEKKARAFLCIDERMNRFRVAPSVRVRAATAARRRFVFARSAGAALTSSEEFC